MTADQIIDLAKWVGMIAGGTVTTWKFIESLFKYLERKATEKSVGASAIVELMEADKSVRKDIETIKDTQDEQQEAINKLENHYDMVVAQAIKILTTK